MKLNQIRIIGIVVAVLFIVYIGMMVHYRTTNPNDIYQLIFNKSWSIDSVKIEATKSIEEKKWVEATRTETLVSYRKYLNEFPQGLHVAEATKKIETLVIMGTIQVPTNTPVAGCKVYLFAVGSDGRVNATLRDQSMGLTDSLGDFSIPVNHADMTNIGTIAFIVDCSTSDDILISRPVKLGTDSEVAVSITVGHIKVAANTGDKLQLAAKKGQYLSALNVKTGALQRLLNGATVSGKMAGVAP